MPVQNCRVCGKNTTASTVSIQRIGGLSATSSYTGRSQRPPAFQPVTVVHGNCHTEDNTHNTTQFMHMHMRPSSRSAPHKHHAQHIPVKSAAAARFLPPHSNTLSSTLVMMPLYTPTLGCSHHVSQHAHHHHTAPPSDAIIQQHTACSWAAAMAQQLSSEELG